MEIRAKEFRFPETEELEKLEKGRGKIPDETIKGCFNHLRRLPRRSRFQREIYELAFRRLYETTKLPKKMTFPEFRREVEEIPKLLKPQKELDKKINDLRKSLETRKELIQYADFLKFLVGVVPRGADGFTFFLLEKRGEIWLDEEANLVYKILCCDKREPVRFPSDILVSVVERARTAIKALKEKRKIGYEVALENYARPLFGEDETVGAMLSQKCSFCKRDASIQLRFDIARWGEFQRKFVGE